MKCPKCNEEMDQGIAKVEGTALGFLVVGFSHQHLFYKGKKKERIVHSGDETLAYRCASCDLTILEGQSRRVQRHA